MKNRIDSKILLVSFLVLGAALSLLFFYDFDGDSRTGLLMGQVVELKNDVRFKSRVSLSWKAAKDQMKVLEGDRFFAGPESHVKIKLVSGEEVLIQANSMVEVRINNSQLGLALSLGWVEVSKNGKVQKHASQKTLIIPTTAKLTTVTVKDEEEFIDVQPVTEAPLAAESEVQIVELEKVLDNELPLQTESPKPPVEEVKPEKVFEMAAVEKVTVKLKQAKAQDFESGQYGSFRLDWKRPENSVGPFEVIVKSLKDNSTEIKKMETENEFITIENPPAATVDVTVQVKQEKAARSSASVNSSIKIKLPAPERLPSSNLLYPVMNQLFVITENAQFSVPLKVEENAQAQVYQVQLSEDANFKSSVIELKNSKALITLQQKLKAGQYYVRSRYLSDYGISGWSTPVAFQVVGP